MKINRVDLPTGEPLFSTYHRHGNAGAVMTANPSIKNWYFNKAINLTCNSAFLSGNSSPRIDVIFSGVIDNPYIDITRIPLKHISGRINSTIKNSLNDGYYVCVYGMDDYYVKEKSLYHIRHFIHDCLVCGYDTEKNTYSIYAYDRSWIYRKFDVTVSCFNRAMRSGRELGHPGLLMGFKAKDKIAQLDINEICVNLAEYLDSSLEKYPTDIQGKVSGIVVHDYIAMYLDKIKDGTIPYEKTDRRVFRMIWDHKKVMLQRIMAVEDQLGMDTGISSEYQKLVKIADNMRLIYLSYKLKRRDALLSVMKKMLFEIKESESLLLNEFLNKIMKEIKK